MKPEIFYIDREIVAALIEAFKIRGGFKIEKLSSNRYVEVTYHGGELRIATQWREDGKPFKRLKAEAVPKQDAMLISRLISY